MPRSTKAAARRALKRAGKDVELTNYQIVEEDSHGPHPEPTADSPMTVTAVEDPGSRNLAFNELFGAEVEADTVYLIRGDIDGIRDGGGDDATEIVNGDSTYVVLDADPSHLHGLNVLECERIETEP